MTSTSVFESESFNRRLVEKLVEQRDQILGGKADSDAASVWQQIALELSQDWELDCGDLRWQDLSRYFRCSLVLKLSHRKWTMDQGLIDRLQYPYLRKVYVITIQFYRKYCAKRMAENSSEIEDNKLFIKYTMDGRFDPDVVSAFKRRSRKGVRIYVNINVDDPVYNLPDDVKKLLLQMEHHRRERFHKIIPSDEARESSPVLLDGVPVPIENRSPAAEKDFSPRDLLEKESFSVNTQEYDEIIKESLERELPPIPKRRRLGSFSPGCVEVWLETCEMQSPAKSCLVVSPQDDPLHMSTRISLSEPQFRPATGVDISQACAAVELVRSQPPTLIMASQLEASTQDSIRIKQEPSIDASSEIPTLDAGFDPLLSSVFTDSDNEEEENDSGPGKIVFDNQPAKDIVSLPTEADQHEPSEAEAIITSRTTQEQLGVDRSQPPTLILASQPETTTQELIRIKQEHKTEDLKTTSTLQADHDPYLNSVLTDSEDTEEETAPSSSNGISGKNVNYAIMVDNRRSPPSKDKSNSLRDEQSEPNRSEVEIVSSHPPMTLILSSSNGTPNATVKQESEIKVLDETPPADAVHDPYLNGIFTDSDDDDDDDEEEENAPSFKSVISNQPSNEVSTSENRSCPNSEETSNPKPNKCVQDQSELVEVERQFAPLVIASQEETQESVPRNTSEVTLDPHISSICRNSDDEDEEETNKNSSLTVENLNTTSVENHGSSSSTNLSSQIENLNLDPASSLCLESDTTVPSDPNCSNTTPATQNSSNSPTTTTTPRCCSVVDRRLGMPALNNSLEPVPLHCIVRQRIPPVTVAAELSSGASQPRNSEVDSNETEAVAQPMIQPSSEEELVRHPTHNQPLQDSQNLGDPIGHSYQSTDSNRLVIAWSPSSSSSSSGMTQVSKAEAPPTATSPTGPQFREEQYDSIQPAIESRLRLQAVLRSLWPELFARGGSFCDFLHLLSILALNIFPRLQPTTDRGAIELLRMVSPIACRLAYGNIEPIADKQARVCPATRKEGVREDRGAGGDGAESERCGLEVLDETQGNSKSSSIDETPMIVLSDDDEQENLPVRTKREYRVHK
nr:uncharacterized protein LOC109410409 isoform X1 [Aedes albopictus]